MELGKVLKERRTIRKYFAKDVSWLLVSEILEAGRLAPSSGNLQNWYFIVIKDKEIKKKIIDLSDDSSWALNAPVFIAICADTERAKRMFGSKGVELYSIQNCACASMQMLLKACDLGLSSAWLGNYDEKEVSKVLGIKQDSRLMNIIVLGYGESNEELDRKDLSTMVFFDKFGMKERKGDYAMLPLNTPLQRSMQPMKEKLKNAFSDVSEHHKEKVKDFVGRFKKKKE